MQHDGNSHAAAPSRVCTQQDDCWHAAILAEPGQCCVCAREGLIAFLACWLQSDSDMPAGRNVPCRQPATSFHFISFLLLQWRADDVVWHIPNTHHSQQFSFTWSNYYTLRIVLVQQNLFACRHNWRECAHTFPFSTPLMYPRLKELECPLYWDRLRLL